MTAPLPAVIIPAWPRAMDASTAGAYCSCDRKALPAASYGSGRSARWLREDLDMHLDQLAGRRRTEPADEWAEAQP